MGRVADYSDWRYRILFGDRIPAPVGWWLASLPLTIARLCELTKYWD
jgi:hypothetical protein